MIEARTFHVGKDVGVPAAANEDFQNLALYTIYTPNLVNTVAYCWIISHLRKMKIYSPSQVILSVLGLAAIVLGYLFVVKGIGSQHWFLLIVVLAISVYVVKAQLDYWWHTKSPVDLDSQVIDYLESRNRFYQSLGEEDQKLFRDRLSLYLEARLFEGIAAEKKRVPEDIKVLVAVHAVEVGLRQEDILIGDFDRIFLYQHPFGSPQKQFLHIVETEIEDGVIILMTPYLINAINHPTKYYNIAYHAFAEAIVKQNPQWDLSCLDALSWEEVERISGFKKEPLLKALGYEQYDLVPIFLSLYHSHRARFEEELPEIKKALSQYFS